MQIFVWSMKTGRLLDMLSGHEGPVYGLAFSPTDVSILFLHYGTSLILVESMV